MLNLWELMTLMAEIHPVKSKREEIQQQLHRLGNNGQIGQELSIDAEDGGWKLTIHSCYSNLDVTVLVPQNWHRPTQILSDNRGKVTCD